MALWQKVKSLNHKTLGDITSMYCGHNIPIEVRDFCSIWIEASIKLLNPEAFATGLHGQVREKLMSLNESEEIVPFYVVRRLTDFQNELQTIHSKSPADLHNRFMICLDSEKLLVKRYEESLPLIPVESVGSPPTTVTEMHSMSPSTSHLQNSPTSCHSPSTPTCSGFEPETMDQEETFLNNPIRIIIDREMNRIFEIGWSLEEANNMLTFKCHELKRHKDVRNANVAKRNTPAVDSAQQLQMYVEFQEVESQINELTGEIIQMITQISCSKSEVRNRALIIVNNWTHLKSTLDNDLATWNNEQRLFANGRPMTVNINSIQHVAEYLLEVALKFRHLLMKAESVQQTNLPAINTNMMSTTGPTILDQIKAIEQHILKLVQDTFVVVHQPCQVLKTNTRFHVPPGKSPMEVRLLVGEKLGLKLAPPTISVSLVDEATCKDIDSYGLQGNRFKKVKKIARLLPETSRLDYSSEQKCSAAIFRQISLKDFFRNGRKTIVGKEQAECVTEEKFALLFRSEFSVGDMNFQIYRLTLPLVITTHGSQDSLAWAAVTWDNTFSQPGRVPFYVPDTVNWMGVREVLQSRFTCMVGAPLSEDNLKYFADRVASISPGFPNCILWSELFKVNLSEKKFTFWDWFYDGAKMIEQHLKDAWRDGHVVGFIDRDVSERMLCNSQCAPGTFLFRFSESILGGISIVWLHSDGKAYHLNPFRNKDFANQPLVEKLEQDTLHYVYPRTPKLEAFKKYYEEYKTAVKTDNTSGPDNDRYVRFRNQLVIDDSKIPKFCVAEKSAEAENKYKVIVCSQEPPPNVQCNNYLQTDGTVLEIDIDSIVNCMTQEISPIPDYDRTKNGHGVVFNGLNGHRNGNLSLSEDIMYSEESFYMQL